MKLGPHARALVRPIRLRVANLVAPLLAKALAQGLPGDMASRYFDLWQRHGFHITRNHYYSPVPDTRTLPVDLDERESTLAGVAMNESAQLELVQTVFARHAAECASWPTVGTIGACFHFNNGRFDGLDALALYCLLRHFQPMHEIEVGSGYSTRVASLAISANGHGSITCIEPYPEPWLDQLPGVAHVVAQPVQSATSVDFSALAAGDILFIDSTHVVRTGGDVPFLFLEILPLLAPGVIVHVHDIFLPRDYPRTWLTDQHLFWSEQYLLHAFLLFNDTYEVLFSSSFMAARHATLLHEVFPFAPAHQGGSFWLRRKARSRTGPALT